MERELYDFHSHILPGMDDGYQTAADAVKALELAYGQGVVGMVATPHYYGNEPVADFLARRAKAERALTDAAEGHRVPKLCFGAEVAFHAGMSRLDNLEKLCLGQSRYMLIEMPFEPWSGDLLRELWNLGNQGILPILAHVERYFHIQNRRTLQELTMQDFLIQMNGETLGEVLGGRKARAWLKRGDVQLLGSDCHNLESRKPNMGQAADALCRHRLYEALDMICDVSAEIFEEITK